MIVTQTIVWDVDSMNFPTVQRILDEDIEINWDMNKVTMLDNIVSFKGEEEML